MSTKCSKIKPPPRLQPPRRLRRLGSSPAATQDQCAPKPISWIRPCLLKSISLSLRLSAVASATAGTLKCVHYRLKQAVVRGTINPVPRGCHVTKGQKQQFHYTFSVARWQHRTVRRPQSKQITNTLTFDPPTRLPELTQNLIRSSHGHHTYLP